MNNRRHLHGSYHLGDSKGFRSPGSETMTETKYIFLMINLNVMVPTPIPMVSVAWEMTFTSSFKYILLKSQRFKILLFLDQYAIGPRHALKTGILSWTLQMCDFALWTLLVRGTCCVSSSFAVTLHLCHLLCSWCCVQKSEGMGCSDLWPWIWAQPWNPLWPGLLTSSVHCARCGAVHSVSQLSEHGPQELLLYKTFFPQTMFSCYFKFAFRFLKSNYTNSGLKKGMTTHSSILAWESHGQRSLAGYSPLGCKELDLTVSTEPECIHIQELF